MVTGWVIIIMAALLLLLGIGAAIMVVSAFKRTLLPRKYLLVHFQRNLTVTGFCLSRIFIAAGFPKNCLIPYVEKWMLFSGR